jgi:hypothetical protein
MMFDFILILFNFYSPNVFEEKENFNFKNMKNYLVTNTKSIIFR